MAEKSERPVTKGRGKKRILMLIPSRSMPEYKCPFCGAEWTPRKAMPKVCPACHRRLKWTTLTKKKGK
jgi:DNA-directed RNA polymerase subunit RPC12/RpoP